MSTSQPNTLKFHADLLPAAYVYLSIGMTILSLIGFMSFVSLYTIHTGCPSQTHKYTEVWRVDRNEQLNRFQIQKRAEELLQERDRRKGREITRDEQF